MANDCARKELERLLNDMSFRFKSLNQIFSNSLLGIQLNLECLRGKSFIYFLTEFRVSAEYYHSHTEAGSYS